TLTAGAWIETARQRRHAQDGNVAPHAGAWIETTISPQHSPQRKRSRPTRARGLKRGGPRGRAALRRRVAPHAGAWIETCSIILLGLVCGRRAPRGRVD